MTGQRLGQPKRTDWGQNTHGQWMWFCLLAQTVHRDRGGHGQKTRLTLCGLNAGNRNDYKVSLPFMEILCWHCDLFGLQLFLCSSKHIQRLFWRTEEAREKDSWETERDRQRPFGPQCCGAAVCAKLAVTALNKKNISASTQSSVFLQLQTDIWGEWLQSIISKISILLLKLFI